MSAVLFGIWLLRGWKFLLADRPEKYAPSWRRNWTGKWLQPPL